ncbi:MULTISPECIES: glycosyltransferase family 2 protein [Butyricimonas]|uniref:glycosyltransferase family 2 protein n=1 Tax=Butyricimonas TaxID=574697 RepID=UPI001D06BBDC|nr:MULTISPECIES: glycosyltransferase family A protein [Butyricimonas]MCB6972413.1 glycosyltransferase family 2 protein [Butyricimonas synergistica]MCG4519421.1 glycosyltransferase family 2 protein [Butyricimonas sp. DFI.6.44]
MDKISVIIPVYNLSSYIGRCLDSVIVQTYSELDVIVINDGSKDNSLEILEKYALKDKRIKIVDKENGGVTSCRRVGLELAKGDYVFFLDGDDWLERETLAHLYSCAKNKEADIVLGNVYYSSDIKDEAVVSCSFDRISSKEFIHQLAYGKQLWSLCMKLIKTSVCKKMVIPDGLSMAEDMTGMLQLAFYSSLIAKSDYYGYHYYQRPGASTKSPTLKHAKDALIAAEYITDFFEKQGMYQECFDDIAIINLRCLLTSCNQGGTDSRSPLVERIYKSFYRNEYLSYFGIVHRVILYWYKKGINLYKLLLLFRRWRYA